MSLTVPNGRLGNQIIRNLAVSLIAKKHNLFIEYCNYELIANLGIELFIGTNKYDSTILLTDDNYFSILNNEVLCKNLWPNNNYFQTRDIINFLSNYINSEKIKENIIHKNQYSYRYNKNNDLFIHIRLTDVENFNPGIEYYLKAIKNINFDNIFISTDDREHSIIKKIVNLYPDTKLINHDEIKTIQFGSTCKYIVLSHGSFSAVIGYLSFYSTIYYPEYEENKIWYGDMFSIDGWNKISDWRKN
jgi:hypothetical protein